TPPIDELLDSVDVQQVKHEARGVALPGEPKPAIAGKVTVRKSTTKDRRGKRFGRRKQDPGTATDTTAQPASDHRDRLAVIHTAPAPGGVFAPRLAEPPAPPSTPSASVDVSTSARVDVPEDFGPRHVGRPLGEILKERGLVSEDQLMQALTSQTGSGKRLGNILVELGLLSERALVDVLAEQLILEIVELGRMELDREVVTLLAEDDARRLRAVPIARDGERIDVAVADPLVAHLQEELIEKLGAPVRLYFATP